MSDILSHFLLSAFSGALAFSLTSITLWRLLGKGYRSRSKTCPITEAEPPIFQASLFSGLFFALLLHVWRDGLIHIGGIINMFYFWVFLSRIDTYIQYSIYVAAGVAALCVVLFLLPERR